jgi:serine/threonine protein phosphatase PrpC
VVTQIFRPRAALGLIGLGFLLPLAVLVSPALAARPAATPSHHFMGTPRPRQFVAAARPAVVRLTVQYYAQTTGGSLTPVDALCTGLGTLVGTTGAGAGNTRAFVLTDAQLVSPVLPCAGARIAYRNANKTPPAAWKLTKITAYLDTAYTGDGSQQVGALAFDLDTSAIPTLGLTDGPVVLPLAADTAPPYDLPIVVVSATQPAGTTQLLDLGDAANQPYTQDTITPNVIPQALTAIETSASQPPLVPTPTPVGTAAPHAATATSIPVNLTPAPAPDVSPGAPLVADAGNGSAALAGVVLLTPQGPAIAGIDAVAKALHAAAAVSAPGPFAQHWDAGLNAYYAASPTNPKDANYAAAAAQFQYLQANYSAFGGVTPWLESALAGSPDLGVTATPTVPSSPPPATDIIPGIPIQSKTELAALGIALLALLAGLAFWVRALAVARRNRRRVAEVVPVAMHQISGKSSGNGSMPEDADITAKAPAVKNGNGPVERRADPSEVLPAWRSTVSRPTLPLPQARVARRLGLQAVGITDPGVRRRNAPNQDAVLAVQGARMHEGAPQAFGLFVVADGMGGHQFGREASSETIRVMADHVLQPLLDGHPLDDETLLDLLKTSVERANVHLHYRNLRQRSDMGTTVTAALVTGDMAFIVNVGDSRTYHMQPDLPLRQITNDHSVVASLVAAGIIEPDDIYTHPKRSQIFRSLGEQEDVQVDTFNVVLQPGDQLLLCSDGLWEMVRNPRLEELLRTQRDLRVLSETLIDEANANGGVDNISAIVVRMLGEEATPRQIGMHVLAGPPSIKGS